MAGRYFSTAPPITGSPWAGSTCSKARSSTDATTFGSGLAVASNLLPINAFAAFGTQEAGWTLGFGWLGVERDLALSTAVAVHLVQLFDVVLLGVLGHLAMGAGKREARSGSGPAESDSSQSRAGSVR